MPTPTRTSRPRTRTTRSAAHVACTRHRAVEVEGSTGNRYTVTFTPHGTTCSCPGYSYHRHCRHQTLGADTRCPWTNDFPTRQTTPGSCPLCGAATTPPAAPPLNSAALLRAAILTLIDAGAVTINLYPDAIEIDGPDDFILASWTGRYTAAQLARTLGVATRHITVHP